MARGEVENKKQKKNQEEDEKNEWPQDKSERGYERKHNIGIYLVIFMA